jgi:hypothetical protein
MPDQMQRSVASFVVLWIIVFAATLPMNPPSFAALLLRIRKAESTATITREADPNNHRYVTYQYVVSGRVFSAVGYGPDRKEMQLGKQVRVCFFPAHPQYATIATDREQTEYLRDGVMAGITLATLMTGIMYWRYFRAGQIAPRNEA